MDCDAKRACQPSTWPLAVQRGGPVKVVLHILFARPQQFDRHTRDFFGNEHRLAHKVLRRTAPPETTTQIGPVHRHVRQGNFQGSRRFGLGGFGALRGCPDLRLITGNQRGAVLRLQGEMVPIGREVLSLHLAVALRIGLGP